MLDMTVQSLLPASKREPDVIVFLPGHPRGKGAGRAMLLKANPAKGRYSDRAMVFQDKETRSYEAMLRYAGEKAMAGRPILDCALRCRVTAVFAIPQSKPQKWKADALAGYVRPTVKPDDDNLLKCRDSLKGIVFRDDCLFVESVARKFYGSNPCWMIEIWRYSGLLL